MALAEPLPVPAPEPDDADMTAVLLAAGWRAVATPSGAVFLLDPDLLAALRNGQAT